jgi:DNA-binding NtrC family response regulator
MTKRSISPRKVDIDPDFSPPSDPPDTFHIQKLSLSLTVVSDSGRETVLTLSGVGDLSPQSLSSGPQRLPESEATDVLHIRAGAPMREVEEAYIRLVLSRAGNKKKRAARILGISPHTLSNKLQNFKARRAKPGVPPAGEPQ